MHHSDSERSRVPRRREFHRPPVYENGAGIRCHHPVCDVHEGGLPGAVFSDQRVNFSGHQREIGPAHSADRAEGLPDALKLKKGRHYLGAGDWGLGTGTRTREITPVDR